MLYGLWHAHIGWFLVRPEGTVRWLGWAPDLEADPLISPRGPCVPSPIVLTTLFLPLGLIGGPGHDEPVGRGDRVHLGQHIVRMFLLHHVTWSMNSIGHLWGASRSSRARADNNWPRRCSPSARGGTTTTTHSRRRPVTACCAVQFDPSWLGHRSLEYAAPGSATSAWA